MVMSNMSDAVREFVWNIGEQVPDAPWVLSQYDTWEKNPFYRGHPAPHPEDCFDDEERDSI